MSNKIIPYLTVLQDKTTLKGIYFFLSFCIVITFSIYINFIEIDVLFNPLNNLSQYFIILSATSLLYAVFHYLKAADLFLKRSLLLYKRRRQLPQVYQDITYQDTINHPFIINEKNNFLSKCMFIIALGLLTLITFHPTIFSFIPWSFLIFIIPIIILSYSLNSDWDKMSFKLFLIHMSEVILKSHGNSLKDDDISQFREKLESLLWKDAKISFVAYIDENINRSIITKEEKIRNVLKNVFFISSILYDFNTDPPPSEQLNNFLQRYNIGKFRIDNSSISEISELFRTIMNDLETANQIIFKLLQWDAWMKKIFLSQDLIEQLPSDLRSFSVLNQSLHIFLNKNSLKLEGIRTTKDYNKLMEKKDDFLNTFGQEIRDFQKVENLRDNIETLNNSIEILYLNIDNIKSKYNLIIKELRLSY